MNVQTALDRITCRAIMIFEHTNPKRYHPENLRPKTFDTHREEVRELLEKALPAIGNGGDQTLADACLRILWGKTEYGSGAERQRLQVEAAAFAKAIVEELVAKD